jgi:hypothetical protein
MDVGNPPTRTQGSGLNAAGMPVSAKKSSLQNPFARQNTAPRLRK